MTNAQRLDLAGRIRDAAAEMLAVAGFKNASDKLAYHPPEMLLRSHATVRRRKSPLLQQAFESDARRLVADLKALQERDLSRRRCST